MRKLFLLIFFLSITAILYSQATTQYAATVIDKSSEYGAGNTSYSAQQATGSPNVYPNCGDFGQAWASSGEDNQREWLVLGFNFPGRVDQVRIYQTYNPGAIDTVYLRNASTGVWNEIYRATAVDGEPCPANILEINIPLTSYNVDAVRIALNSPDVSGWNEIDAVSIRTDAPPAVKMSAQSGNWSSTSSWQGGTVPGASDTVVIGNGHTIAVDGNFAVKSIFINTGGGLNLNSANTLTVGPAGGGKERFDVEGSLDISAGTLAVNGQVEIHPGASFEMTGGQMIVDGNDGTSAGSVPNGMHLVHFRSGISPFTFSAGQITIVDPQFHATGQAITGSYVFGTGTTVSFGDGVSTTASNNPRGFGGMVAYPTFGNFIMNAVTGAGNRDFDTYDQVTVTGNATITSGELKPTWHFHVNGNMLNNATITNMYTIRVDGDLTNNAMINSTAGTTVGVNGDFFNNATGIYTGTASNTNTYVGSDFVNNGAFTTGWLYFSGFPNISTNEQTMSGNGTFDIHGLDIRNSHPNGATILLPLTVNDLYFHEGKLFLGNNDLTLTNIAWGSPNLNNYVVVNGTGKLIIENVGITAKLFPIGTNASYTPVSIGNGSNHTFSASVKSTFTAPPFNSSVVNREWNLTDETGGAVNAAVTFQWNASDEDPSFNRNSCYVGRHNGTTWTAVSNEEPADPHPTIPNAFTRTENITQFSPFGIGSNGAFGASLPVDLLTFKGAKKQNAVELEWRTVNETAFSHFELQRSGNGRDFTSLQQIASRVGVQEKTYQAIDATPIKGLNYYRLKMVDQDGKFKYSKIVRVDIDKKYTVFVRPNPARDFMFIEGSSVFRQIDVVDMNGKLVKRFVPNASGRYNISSLKKGMYLLKLVGIDDQQTLRLIVE